MNIRKVLVANRGEVASRIIRTLRKNGIASVAVFHAEDAQAAFVRDADEAIQLAGATPVAAYLDIAQLVDACRATGADAVHPGFGFLSERAAFAEAVGEAGVTFIGPEPHAIRAMGDKIESKRFAQAAGVPTIPGHSEAIEGPNHALEIASRIGYPVMIKATAGGGGKGMRLARDESTCRESFARATAEAVASFGDGRVLIEKYIERPRHIEVQVLGDRHGNVIHLWERECSIQRRFQKVIEEAPSPFLDDDTRRAMCEQAVTLARAVGYASAGTVEFVVGEDRSFYFLEMNTRLQVEHGITEQITGIDLVEEQIHIAAGEPLRIRQDQVRRVGHSIEARICAENPQNDFLPETGRILQLRWPSEARVDSGIREGQSVTASFDPMLAKVLVHGADRQAAIQGLRAALQGTVLLGLPSNISYLERVLAHPDFASGATHTGFLEEHADELLEAGAEVIDDLAFIAMAALVHPRIGADERCSLLDGRIGSWTN